MLPKFLDFSEIDNFAKQLAEDIRLRYPPSVANNPARKISVDRLTFILNSVFQQAAEFAIERKLGYFRRAKLGNDFQWQLKEAGYSQEFVEMATEGLIVFVTDPKRAKAESKAESKPESKGG